jgi:hypothetical protein
MFFGLQNFINQISTGISNIFSFNQPDSQRFGFIPNFTPWIPQPQRNPTQMPTQPIDPSKIIKGFTPTST